MQTSNSRILVTGACGSVGSALVRRLLLTGKTVCAFDQSEDGLFKLDQELHEASSGNLRTFLGNVRDQARLKLAFDGVGVVFHCAALKHVYISEYNPFEAMMTNIEGTNNVIQAAIASNVNKVIMTSSDKAVNPTSTMGATKLIGERLLIAANHFSGGKKTRFSCVRFGNVLNSNGSVLQIFKRQIKQNQPLTITSTKMTRFFISMEQAVDLCLHASNEMQGGEIFVLSMGSANILTLAEAVIGKQNCNFREIGYKPGEKLYEELVTESEVPRTVKNGNIYIVMPDTLELMSEDTISGYMKYDSHPRLTSPLRSDANQMSINELISLLKSAALN